MPLSMLCRSLILETSVMMSSSLVYLSSTLFKRLTRMKQQRDEQQTLNGKNSRDRIGSNSSATVEKFIEVNFSSINSWSILDLLLGLSVGGLLTIWSEVAFINEAFESECLLILFIFRPFYFFPSLFDFFLLISISSSVSLRL